MIKIFLSCLLLMFTSSCALMKSRGEISQQKNEEKEKLENKEAPEVDKQWKLTIEPQNITIKPGEATLLVVPGDFYQEGTLACLDKEIPFFLRDHHLVAFISETYFSEIKPYHCFYTLGEDQIKVAEVEVLPKRFPSERIYVDRKKVFLSKKDQDRVNKERKIRYKAYASSPDRPFFYGPFELPIRSKVTSIYGSKRVFNKKKQTQHLGTDYRAAVGVPIKAANRGKIVLSRDFFYTGNTIVIDHGLGIFTTYGHLSKRLVEEGEVVPAGAIIGKAGSTGRSTGPHLHWGVTVNGLAVEGDSLIEASLGMPR